jgi:hypothetical protein
MFASGAGHIDDVLVVPARMMTQASGSFVTFFVLLQYVTAATSFCHPSFSQMIIVNNYNVAVTSPL